MRQMLKFTVRREIFGASKEGVFQSLRSSVKNVAMFKSGNDEG